MGKDDDEGDLSVTEVGTYTSASQGPPEDTNVHTAASEVHGERPAHLDHQVRNRATPDPMGDLRRSAQRSAEERHPPAAEPVEASWARRLPLIIAAGALGVIVTCTGLAGIIGVAMMSGGGDETPVEPIEPPPAAQAPVAAPPPIPAPVAGPPDPTEGAGPGRDGPMPIEPVDPSAPAPETTPRRKRNPDEFDGVPIRKGLRGE